MPSPYRRATHVAANNMKHTSVFM